MKKVKAIDDNQNTSAECYGQ